jgi:hypothetical protein
LRESRLRRQAGAQQSQCGGGNQTRARDGVHADAPEFANRGYEYRPACS